MPPRHASHFIKLWTSNKHAYAAVHRSADGAVIAAASTTERGLRSADGVAPRPDKEVSSGFGGGDWRRQPQTDQR